MEKRDYDVLQFKSDLSQLQVSLSEKQIDQFLRYYELLIEWNEKINLTAITAYEEVLKKHFIDSLSLIKVIDLTKDLQVIDIGTGAGFPGLALKIAFPNLKVTLLDSLNKRIQFLNLVIDELGLKDIEAIHGRAEDFAGSAERRENYDLCVSRAVANLTTLSEYCLPFVKVGGFFISYKSEKINEEIEPAKRAIDILGGKVENQMQFYLPSSDISRIFVKMEKIKNTPKKYPRKAGLPSKDPIK